MSDTGQPYIVEQTDPATGEDYLTWAALVPGASPPPPAADAVRSAP